MLTFGLTYWNLGFVLDSTLGIYVGSPVTFVGSKRTLDEGYRLESCSNFMLPLCI